MPEVVEHGLLGGRVRLLQPAGGGYRAAIDPVLLAAAMPAQAGARLLDVGVGTGAALLCLLARCPQVEATGLELLPEHADLATRSLALNGWTARIVLGDLRARPAPVGGNAFDMVMTNPPFHGPGTRPPHAGRAGAHMEDVPLAEWLDFCLRRLRPRGVLGVIHRADRLDDILAALAGKAGAVEVIPLWPKAGQPAKRVIVRARKGARGPAVLHPGVVLHEADGTYTPQAQAILRDGAALDLSGGGGR
ncbi:tRNA1(Val) (adenine(37)-N6)-methyltransferase [Novispirillum sp. DQ9]|uniref:tRNA1(Val) (adenine(37)-N6)-methyltransferase n=1 Tax=Novispirillum sp. DQ9 TaxID=3398612 RepID=UPI003C7B1B25